MTGPPAAIAEPTVEPGDEHFHEAAVIASVEQIQGSAAEAQNRMFVTGQSANTATAMTAEQQHQAMWAGAIAHVAGEYTASLDKLSWRNSQIKRSYRSCARHPAGRR